MKSLNYLLELQPDITCEGFKVRRGMTDVQKKKLFKQTQLSPLYNVQIRKRNSASFG